MSHKDMAKIANARIYLETERIDAMVLELRFEGGPRSGWVQHATLGIGGESNAGMRLVKDLLVAFKATELDGLIGRPCYVHCPFYAGPVDGISLLEIDGDESFTWTDYWPEKTR